jgi:acetyl esterase/lipase
MAAQTDAEDRELQVDPAGTIHVPAFRLPPSAALSDYARASTAGQLARRPRISIPTAEACASEEEFKALVDAFRKDVDAIYSDALVDYMREAMPLQITPLALGGVPAEEFLPLDAPDPDRVLINLHGGAFCTGAIFLSRVESIPLAYLGRLRVVSPDYRQGYEHKFPAASEDVCAVYKALLEEYAPSQIGIYGGSAGGILTLQATAWILAQGLPAPGAIGIFGAGTGGQGDAAWFGAIGMGARPPLPLLKKLAKSSIGYFGPASDEDPMVDPTRAPPEFLSRFPPALLITGTRAFDMSPAIITHRALLRAGVEADLHVFDGLGHCFYYDYKMPESQDAYATMIRFFRKHLGDR